MRFKSRTRAFLGSVAAAALGLSGLAMSSQTASAATTLAGADRFGTAASILIAGCDGNNDGDCADGGAEDVATIVVVNGLNFPDALSGSSYGLPILLATPTSVPQATLDAIDAVRNAGADPNIIVVGGIGAINATAIGQLQDQVNDNGGTVTRVSGADRTATSLAVAAANLGAGDTVFLANSTGFADSVSASGPSAADNVPIILTAGSQLSDGIQDFLLDNDVANVIIVGGTAAVSQAVEDDLALFNVVRIAGADRFETNRLLAEYVISGGAIPTTAFGNTTAAGRPMLATGLDFPDALAGGAHAAVLVDTAGVAGPVVLTPTSSLGNDAQIFLSNSNGLGTNYAGGNGPIVFGGEAAVSSQTTAQADAAMAAANVSGTVINVGGAPNANAAVTDDFDIDNGLGTVTSVDYTGDGDADTTSITYNGATVTPAELALVLKNGDTATLTPAGALSVTPGNGATNGTVGLINVNTLLNTGTFNIVTTSGNQINTTPFVVEAGTAFSVDGSASDADGLANDLSVGDTVVVQDGADGGTTADDDFALTNQTLSGSPAANVFPTTIGLLGDDPDTGDAGVFVGDAESAKVVYLVDGISVDVLAFQTAMDPTDSMSYMRTGDVETFSLTSGAAAAAPDASFIAYTAIQDANNDIIPVLGTQAFTTVGQIVPGDLAGTGGTTRWFVDGVERADFDAVETDLINLFGATGVAPFGHMIEYVDAQSAAGTNTFTVTSMKTSTRLPISAAGTNNNNTADAADTVTVDDQNGNVFAFDLSQDFSGATTPANNYTVNGNDVSIVVFEDFLNGVATNGLDGNDFFSVTVSATGNTFHLFTDEAAI